MPNVVAGVPKEKPPPAGAAFAWVPKLNEPAGLAAAGVEVPNANPPPVAAGVEVLIPKPVAGAAAAVGFWAPKEKPVEACPKLNPPLMFSFTGGQT